MNTLKLNEKYLVDKDGQQDGVLLTIHEFRSLMKRLEELEAFKSAREEINIMEQILAEAQEQDKDNDMPTFKRRQGPGGMMVV